MALSVFRALLIGVLVGIACITLRPDWPESAVAAVCLVVAFWVVRL